MRTFATLSLMGLALVACSGDDTKTDTDDDTTTDTTPADTDTDTDADSDTDADTDADSDADSDADTDTDTDTQTTDTDPNAFNLTFMGTGYEPHDTQTIYFAIANAGTMPPTVTATAMMVMDSTGIIDMMWTNVLIMSGNYVVAWYADMDGDGNCTPGTDHVWSEMTMNVMADVTITRDHDLVFDNQVCALF